MRHPNRVSCVSKVLPLLLLVTVLCVPAHAFLHDTFSGGPGYPNRVDDHIDSLFVASPSQPVDIIVDFCSTPTPADSTFLAGYGTIYGVFRFVDAIAVRGVIVSDCYNIVNYPRVKLIEWDEVLRLHTDISVCAVQARGSATYPCPAQAVWDLGIMSPYMGMGVNVAIIDSGVDDGHPAFAGKFVAGYDGMTQQGGPTVNPDDDMVGWFHGTTVAGIVMADDPGQQYMGVAPKAGLIDCKVFDATGTSPPSRYTATMQWIIQNAQTYNIQVANMSFGGRPSDGTDITARAADALVAAGVVVVASIGNLPPTFGIASPGAADNVISVGGVTDNGTILRTDDVYHPNARIGPRNSPPPSYVLSFNDLKPEVSDYMGSITTCQGSNPGQGGAGWWQHPADGTSWATAHTTGVVALILNKYPGLPPSQVDILLRTNAEARGPASYPALDPTYNTQYGWGIVSAVASMNAVFVADVSIGKWIPGNWNSQSIWAGHYPVKVGDPNTLNARIEANGSFAPGVVVTFEVMRTGWGSPWMGIASTTVNVPSGGSAVATINYTPPPGMDGHKCFRVTATYAPDPNPANNQAQENIDVQPAGKSGAVFASGGATASREAQRYAFPVTMCVEPTAPVPFRTAAACICKKDLPPGADAWLEPEPPFDLLPGQCQACSLIVVAPEGVSFSPGDAVYVNGWFWGNGVAEGGMTVYFVSPPPIVATVAEIQYTDDPLGASPLLGQTVTVGGIATTGSGNYPDRLAIQDGDGPWSGLFLRDPGIVMRGDEVTVTGTVAETGGLTEIDPIDDIVVESSGNPLPAPELLAPGIISASESYEGVLVEAENVIVTDDVDPDNWEITADGSCRVGHWGSYMYVPMLGNELNVTGVVGSLEELLKLQPRDGADIVPATGVPPDDLPSVVSMSQNSPNPFVGRTGISYTLPHDSDVALQVYSVAGRLVRTLVNGRQPAGRWTIVWDGMDESASPVSSGVYFYSLTAGGRTVGKRMVLIE